MGTRGNVVVYDNGKPIVRIYRQFDCYPEYPGMGQALKDILLEEENTEIINGIQSGQDNPRYFNGMGDLAAYLVKNLKNSIGNVYLYPIDHDPYADGWEEYVYSLYKAPNGQILVKVEYASDPPEKLYFGRLKDMDPDNLVNEDKEEVNDPTEIYMICKTFIEHNSQKICKCDQCNKMMETHK